MFNTVHTYCTAHQLLGTLLKLTFYFFISGCGPISAVGLEYRYFGPQGTSLTDRSFVYLLAIAECLNAMFLFCYRSMMLVKHVIG